MKAFLIGTALAAVLAVATGFVLEGYFARTAEEKFSAPSARVEEPMGSGEVQELPTDERR